MEEQLIYIAMILLFGTLCSALAYFIRVSDVFFLLLAGMVLGKFGLVPFGPEFIVAISTLAIIFILFKTTSELKIRELIKYSAGSLKMAFLFLIFCVLFMSFFAYTSLELDSVALALLFSILVYSIDPEIVVGAFRGKKNRALEVLKIESLINTPITVIVSLFLLKSITTLNQLHLTAVGDISLMLLKGLGTGVVVGGVLGFIIATIMKKTYFGNLSHLAVITSAIIAYVGSEALNGIGVAGVVVFGLVFGNVHVEHKFEVERFASVFSNTLNILVFVLIGSLLFINPEHIIKGTFLFIAYLCIRFLTTIFALNRVPFKERLFMTFAVSKGVDVAIVVLLMSTTTAQVAGLQEVTSLVMLFILYGTVLSTITSTLSNKFIKNIKRG